MRKIILPLGPLFGLMMVVVVLSGLQMALYSHFKGNGAKVAVDVTCTVQDATVDDDKAVLVVDCQGRKTIVRNPSVVVNYLKNPGPLTCTVYKSNKAECRLGKR